MAANRFGNDRLISGEIENGTSSEVHTVVVQLGAYDNENVRIRSLYATVGPLPAGTRTRFTVSCQVPCAEVRVETIDAL
ncbi:FxLYD domain-containing protein [Caballeronia sp. EK]|uniref:FxLYD domain-containing protein n=1 Tax=Caballeronia sp. EK TaxID=2767469 RepID=UPI001CA46B7A